jgi:tetratricopeptide (TPR) repeat protein
VLDTFREAHPEHALAGEATKQLANLHRQQGELELAAVEFERIAVAAEDEEARREALLVAGELYEEAGNRERAIDVYQGYVERYPEPLELAVETRFKIASLHDALGDAESRFAQLRWIVDADGAAGAERSDRIRYLAARSALVLTAGYHDRFVEVRLVQPFEESLAEKKRLMDAALTAFGRLIDYEVGEVTAAATFYMAETYRDFSEALLDSERPGDLEESELLDYELVLEGEAFPFEEKAIEVHEKNLELMNAGVYNGWIEKSLGQLGELMPGRYAKFEESSGLIASIDRYAYQAPKPPVADTVGPASETDDPGPALVPELPTDSEPATAVRRLEILDGAVVAEN